MTDVAIAAAAGVLLSLLFSYIPGFRSWFEAKSADAKRLLMLLFMFVVAGGSYALVCGGLGASFGLTWVCDQAGFLEFLKVFFAVLVANQAAYAISPGVHS